MTGKKSNRNFTAGSSGQVADKYSSISAPFDGPRLDAFADGGGNLRREGKRQRLGIEAGALVRERRVERIEGEIHHRRVLGADRGDGEIHVQHSPRSLGVGAFEIG